ncbi:MAG: hypothetical protein ACYDER_01425 [Ktedonobacteraceae bacterium]
MKNKIFLTLFVFFTFVLITGGFYIYYHQRILFRSLQRYSPVTFDSTPVINLERTCNPSTATTTITKSKGVITFSGFCISFKLTELQSNPEGSYNVGVKIVGKRVYVGEESDPEGSGEFAEVFQKNPSDSIEAAISKAVMKGYSSADCPINPIQVTGFPNSYEFAEIDYTGYYPSNCPGDYVAFDNETYFLVDKNHPDKLIYLFLGQFGIATYDTAPWQYGLTVY